MTSRRGRLRRDQLAVVTALSVVVVSGCGARAGDAASSAQPSPAVAASAIQPPATTIAPPAASFHAAPIPAGTYKATVTRKDAERFGVTKCAPRDISENTGHIEVTFRNGRFEWRQWANHPIGHPFFSGTYAGSKRRVRLTFNPNTADMSVDTLQWRFDGKYLHLEVVDVVPPGHQHLCVARMVYQAHAWKKTE